MATKFKCKLEPRHDALEKYIWDIRSLQLKYPDLWSGRTYYYCNPPYYKMKAVTNTEKIIHFSFNDPSVPEHLRQGGKGFCHQMAQEYISKLKGLNAYYKGKRFRIHFHNLQEEVRIQSGSNFFYADLQGKIISPDWFVKDIGTDVLIVEISFSSKTKIKKQSAYREANIAAIEVNYENCYSYQNEKYFPRYSDEKLENAKQTLFKYIDNSYSGFKILHFPSQKSRRYQESRITQKAKSAYLNQEMAAPATSKQIVYPISDVAPNPILSDSTNARVHRSIKHNKEATKSFVGNVFQNVKELIGLWINQRTK